MLSIKTNPLALRGQQNQSTAQSGLETAMERLSSGSRVNGAKDDSAGQAIGNRMTSQINGFHQAVRNTNDGISLLQTAEGGLDQINDNLQRIRELTVQGLTDTLNDTDKLSVINEINTNLLEIERIKESSNFNGIPLLQEETKDISLQVGANKGDTLSLNTALFLDTEALREKVLTLNNKIGVDNNGGNDTEVPVEEEPVVEETFTPIDIDLNTAVIKFNSEDIDITDTSAFKLVENEEGVFLVDEGDIFSVHKLDSYKAEYNEETNVAEVNINVAETIYQQITSFEYSEPAYIAYGNMSGFITSNDNRTLYNGKDGKDYVKVEESNGDIIYYETELSSTRWQSDSESNYFYTLYTDISGPYNENEVPDLTLHNDLHKHNFNNNNLYDVVKNSDGKFFAMPQKRDMDITFTKIDNMDNQSTGNRIYLDNSVKENFNFSNVNTITANNITSEPEPVPEEPDPEPVDPEEPAPNELDDMALLESIDYFIENIDTKRSYIGASVNRLESIIDNLNVMNQNLTEARSRILDADYAVETGKLAKSQILQQASTSMLAQANQNPEIVLSLLEQV